MDVSNRDKIAQALELAINGLSPYVARVLAPLIPEGVSWTSLLEARDSAAGIHNKTYSRNDLQAILRVMTERMGTLGFPFSSTLPRLGQNLASELREVRNRWAHHDEFTDDDTYRAIDTTERLLRSVGATDEAEQAQALKGSPPASLVVSPVEVAAIDPETVDEVGDGEFDIAIDVVPVLSYAAAHNRLPIVNSVTIENSGRARRGATLILEAASALGTLSLKSEHLIDIAADSTYVFNEAALWLDPAHMLRVEESRPASITATVSHEGVVLARARHDVELLAAHQWVRQPEHLATELLAAYVQPNHPAIAALLSETSDWLKVHTGNASLDAYQSDEERVDQIAQAIFETMKARDIRYSNPPASWGDTGQKIRNPEEVLVGRVGTCLDTTVVFAAALEQTGIRPLLWLLEGHAFVGYWRQEDSLGAAANSESLEAINLVDLKYIGVIETTMLTSAVPDATFAQAAREPIAARLQGRPDDILGITDVFEARRAHIIPIPARTGNDDGNVTVTEYHPAAASSIFSSEYGKGHGALRTAEKVPYRVAQWKNSLLDLSLRNRLINFGERGRLSLAIPEGDVGHAEDVINDNKGISLIPSDQIPEVMRARGTRYGRDLSEEDRSGLLREKLGAFVDVTEAAYLTRLRGLAYKAKTIEEETGANNLYLALGTLLWTFNSRELRSPLILVPVRLQPGRGGKYRVVLDESGSSTPNYCLLEKLRQVHGITIPGLAEPTEDASGIDLDAAFRSTREALERARLPYRVEATVDLSILQFAKFRLWKDLDENWEEFAKNPLVAHLIHSPTAQFVDPVEENATRELDALIPLVPVPADSSQLAAVAAAAAGRTFVLEGPPGTGKSQTITNLLVRAVAEGKKVLFVAEKKAALQVVQRRLDEVGLGAFALDLHDKGSRPAAVRAQIKDALQHRVVADQDGLLAATESLESGRRTLERYAARLHETNDAGLSFYSSRTRLLASDQDLPPVEVPKALVTSSAGKIEELRAILRELPEIADPARPSVDHPWGFIDRELGLDPEALLELARSIDSLVRTTESNPEVLQVLHESVDAADISHLADLLVAPSVSISTVDEVAKAKWATAAKSALRSLETTLDNVKSAHPRVSPSVMDLDLDQIHAEAVAADTSRFFGRKKRRIAVRSQIAEHLPADELPPPRQLSTLTSALASAASSVRSSRDTLNGVVGLENSSPNNPWAHFDSDPVSTRIEWLEWLGRTIGKKASQNTMFAMAMRELHISGIRANELSAPLETLSDEWESLSSSAGTSPELLAKWMGGQSPVDRWTATRARRDLDGGERRLNVAITRARRQVILFSSFDPADLRAEESSSVGLRHLRAYLELAAGRTKNSGRMLGLDSVDRHREQIADRLRARGLAVTTDVGLSDFKIDLSVANLESPESPILAILLDNRSWATRKTVADRDGLPVSVLLNLMKWPGVARVWMPQWISDADGVVDELVAEFERASDRLALSKLEVSLVEEPPPIATEDSEPRVLGSIARVVNIPEATRASAPASQREFDPWPVRRVGGLDTLDNLPSRGSSARVEEVIREIVAAEGPVHIVRLAKLAASAFGLERVAQSRVERIVRCIPSDLRAQNDKTYLWPPNVDPDDWHLYRRSVSGTDRPLEHVHPKEIVNAMVAISIRDHGLFEDELRRETLHLFGISRMTPNMTMLLDSAFKLALDTGRLVRADSGVIAVP